MRSEALLYGMREYTRALAELRSRVKAGMSLDERLRAVVDVYWAHFGFDRPATAGKRGVSWCGFYRREVTDEAGQEMTLICREPKPACSPIGLGGMCGRGWRDEAAYVVRDVRVLGANYIACDPKDQSELVIPVWDVGGQSASEKQRAGVLPTPDPSQGEGHWMQSPTPTPPTRRASREGLLKCWGVFDVDSYDVGSFDVSDAEGAIAMLEVAGLRDRARLKLPVRVL